MVLESTWITEVIGTQQGSTDWRYVRRNVPGQNVSFWSLQITQPQNESSNWDICMRISKNITKNKITIAKIRRLLWPGQSTKVSFCRILQSKVEIFRKFCPRVKTCRFHKRNQFFHFSFWIHHYYSWAFLGISNWCWSLIGYIFSPINIKFETLAHHSNMYAGFG